jgi:hypothetical protein
LGAALVIVVSAGVMGQSPMSQAAQGWEVWRTGFEGCHTLWAGRRVCWSDHILKCAAKAICANSGRTQRVPSRPTDYAAFGLTSETDNLFAFLKWVGEQPRRKTGAQMFW